MPTTLKLSCLSTWQNIKQPLWVSSSARFRDGIQSSCTNSLIWSRFGQIRGMKIKSCHCAGRYGRLWWLLPDVVVMVASFYDSACYKGPPTWLFVITHTTPLICWQKRIPKLFVHGPSLLLRADKNVCVQTVQFVSFWALYAFALRCTL